MKRAQEHIRARQTAFAKHPFFERLRRDEPLDRMTAFIPAPTFFVLTFQDILRLNESRMKDPFLRAVAKHHRVEDAGHDRWFLHDLEVLTGEQPDVRWLFGASHARTRDAAYALIAEIFRTDDDRLRILLLLVLESSGEVMFREMVDYLARAGSQHPLRYFARSHLDVERGHELFESKLHERLESIVLSEDLRAEATALVDRAYDAIESMYGGFEARIVDRLHAQPSTFPHGAPAQGESVG